MEILNEIYRKKWKFITALGFFLFLLYSQLLRHDPFVDVDDFFLTNPITKINTFSDYVQARNEAKIQDVQPVRDFSYWMDQRLQSLTGLGIYHFTNFIIWLGIIGTFALILIQLGLSTPITFAFLFLFAFHPALNTTVSWISGRKHLLSAFFALLSTLQLLKGITWKSAFLIPLTYALSCFSQTISICWPAWALGYWFLDQKGLKKIIKPKPEEWIAFSLSVVIAFICAWVNYKYYYVTYVVQNAGVGKFADSSWNTLYYKILACGRYVFQILVPGWIIIPDHYPGNPQDFFGLLFIMALTWGSIKLLGFKRFLAWSSLFVFFLLPVLIRMTNVYVSDTYLLIPTVSIWILLATCTQKILQEKIIPEPFLKPEYLAGSFFIIAFFFLISTAVSIRSFQSSRAMWEHAYFTEKTPANSARYALFLLEEGKVDESLEIGLTVEKWSPTMVLLPKLIAKSVFLKKNMSIEEKVRFLEGRVPLSPWYSYYAAVLYASRGVFERADQLLRAEIDNRLPFLANAMRDEIEMVAVGAQVFCTYSKKKNCANLLQKIKSAITFHDWNEPEYSRRLVEFGMH